MKNFENQRKIVKLSRFFRALCTVTLWLMVFVPLVYVGANLLVDFARAGIPNLPHATDQDQVRLRQQAIMAVAQVPSYIILFIIVYKLRGFFERLSQGILFDAESAACLRFVGLLWLVNWFYSWVPALIHQITAYQQMNVLHVMVILWDNVSAFNGLILGLAILLVAWLFQEAQGLQDERQLTV